MLYERFYILNFKLIFIVRTHFYFLAVMFLFKSVKKEEKNKLKHFLSMIQKLIL